MPPPSICVVRACEACLARVSDARRVDTGARSATCCLPTYLPTYTHPPTTPAGHLSLRSLLRTHAAKQHTAAAAGAATAGAQQRVSYSKPLSTTWTDAIYSNLSSVAARVAPEGWGAADGMLLVSVHTDTHW